MPFLSVRAARGGSGTLSETTLPKGPFPSLRTVAATATTMGRQAMHGAACCSLGALLLLSSSLGGAAAAAAATEQQQQQPKKKPQGPLVLPLTYKPRQYATPLGGMGWSTMSADGKKVGGWEGGCFCLGLGVGCAAVRASIGGSVGRLVDDACMRRSVGRSVDPLI